MAAKPININIAPQDLGCCGIKNKFIKDIVFNQDTGDSGEELREDGGQELREDGGIELREPNN